LNANWVVDLQNGTQCPSSTNELRDDALVLMPGVITEHPVTARTLGGTPVAPAISRGIEPRASPPPPSSASFISPEIMLRSSTPSMVQANCRLFEKDTATQPKV